MKRLVLALFTLSGVAAASGPASAFHPKQYGSVGFQMGFYRYPPPGYAPAYPAAPSGCYGYGPGYGHSGTASPRSRRPPR